MTYNENSGFYTSFKVILTFRESPKNASLNREVLYGLVELHVHVKCTCRM